VHLDHAALVVRDGSKLRRHLFRVTVRIHGVDPPPAV
jgi:hypothetical protein